MKKILIGLLSIMLTFAAVAEEHPLGKITGHNANLVTFDHSFAGELNGTTVFGVLDESIFTSEITVRKYGQTIRAEFKKNEERIGGTIIYQKEDREIALNLYVVKVDGENKKIILNIIGEEVAVSITSEAFENGHFINPTMSYSMNGQNYAYTMEGEACYGMLMHFSMMLISANII